MTRQPSKPGFKLKEMRDYEVGFMGPQLPKGYGVSVTVSDGSSSQVILSRASGNSLGEAFGKLFDVTAKKESDE